MNYGDLTSKHLGEEINLADEEGKIVHQHGKLVGISHSLRDGERVTELAFEGADGERNGIWEYSDEPFDE